MASRRVKFEDGEQIVFIKEVMKNISAPTLKELTSRDIGLSYSRLKKYYQGKSLMPEDIFEELCLLSGISKDKFRVSYLSSNWGAIRGGKMGIRKMRLKYPNLLSKWRALGGKNSPGNTKEMSSPKLNEELAEFIGAYLGDGTLTRYFIRISGDRRYDYPYFVYLSKLIYVLFGIEPKIVFDKRAVNTFYLLVSSCKVCSFLNKEYGLKFGDKIRNKTLIPEQIVSNRKLAIACLRGLVDTDGSVSRRGKQFCVQFRSHNPLLLRQVNVLGKELGLFTYLSKTETGTNREDNVLEYFKIIGSSNMKHIVRFYSRYKEGRTLYVREVPDYYKKPLYRNIKLPFQNGPVV